MHSRYLFLKLEKNILNLRPLLITVEKQWWTPNQEDWETRFGSINCNNKATAHIVIWGINIASFASKWVPQRAKDFDTKYQLPHNTYRQ